MYADNMLNTSFLKNLSHKFRVTSGNDNQLQTLMITTIVFHYHALKSLCADQTTPTIFGLKEQKVTLTLVHVVKFGSKFFFGIQETMSTEVYAHWVLCENLIERIRCALALRDSEADLSLVYAILDLQELFLKVERRHQFVDLLFNLLMLTLARDYEWTCEQKRKMKLLCLGIGAL